MAVQPQTPYIEHIANGATKAFHLEFDCKDKDHLIVLIDDQEPIIGDWDLDNGSLVFKNSPKNGAIIKAQRNTPFRRDRDYQSYDNSFRPPAVNNDFDWIWFKLQELGVADWILGNRIDALKNYVDLKDDELRAYLMEEIRKQGVALDQLDEYYNYLMERLAQIAVDKGWDASFVVDGDKNQHQINTINNKKTFSIFDLGNPTGKKALLSEFFLTLQDAKLVFPFATDLSNSYDWALLQKFINEVATYKRSSASISGNFYVNKPLIWDGDSTKSITWDAEIILDNGAADDWALTFKNHAASHVGRLDLSCYASDSYDAPDWSLRSWFNGIKTQRVVGADFSSLAIEGRLKGRLFYVDGRGFNGNYFKGGSLSGYCGSTLGSFTRNITAKVNSGLHSTIDQRTEITIDTVIDFSIKESLIKIGTNWHLVTANAGNKITVYPWVVDAATTLNIIYGGILKTTGNDANVLTFKQVRGFSSANVLAIDTDYGVTIESFGAEFCSNAVQYNLTPSNSVGSLEFKMWYTEVNDTDIIDVSGSNNIRPIIISNHTGLISGSFVSDIRKLAPVDSGGLIVQGLSTNISMPDGFVTNSTEINIVPDTGYSSSDTNYQYLGYKRQIRQLSDIAVITIAVDEKAKKLGFYEVEIIHSGTRLNGAVTRTTLSCEAPYSFEDADEANNRALYFPASSSPRRLIVRLHGTVFRVSVLSEPSRKAVGDLSVDFGTGIVNTVSSTNNTGVGFPVGETSVQSFKVNQDSYTAHNVDFSYAVMQGNKPIFKIRSRVGEATSNWQTVIHSGLFENITNSAEDLPSVVAKINELLALLKHNS